jgi:hypothetical protein
LGLRRKAKQHKIILRAMMQIAVRHGVIDTNPVDGVGAVTPRRPQARGKVQDHNALPAFRSQIRAWAPGEAIPGKSDNGWRRILLPNHSVEAIREAMKHLEATSCPNPQGLLFPARNGSLRNPNKFGRTWRAARGENFAWVTPRTFRKGAATAVDHAYGDPERAARQLGDTRAVAKAHYIGIPETVPDNREVLERWAQGDQAENVRFL